MKREQAGGVGLRGAVTIGMLVEEIMRRNVVTVGMDDDLGRVHDLFERHGIHHLLVVDRGQLAGVLSDRDLLRTVSPFLGTIIQRHQDLATMHRRVHQVMSRTLVTVTPDSSVGEAVELLLWRRVSCLPVLDERGRVVGIVTWRDLLFAFARQVEEEQAELLDRAAQEAVEVEEAPGDMDLAAREVA